MKYHSYGSILFRAPSRSVWAAALLVGLLVFSAFLSSAERGLTLTVLVGKGAFKTGEPIPLELNVRYGGEEPLILSFSTAQRYDFQIGKEGGEILWRWSEGRMFAQVLGRVVLRPDRPEIRYRAMVQGHLPPGRYQVRGLLTTRPRSYSALAEITIQ